MYRLSRRQFAVAATGAVTAAAGCTGSLRGSDGADYDEWLAAELFEDVEGGTAMYVDLQRLTSEWPEKAQEEFELEEIAEAFAVDLDDVEGLLSIEGANGSGAIDTSVLLGSFDAEPIVEDVEAEMEARGRDHDPEEYDGFQVFVDEVAIGGEAIVVGPEYVTLIDAGNGDTDRITDVDENWAAVLDDVGGGALSVVRIDSDEGFELLGLSMNADGSRIEVAAHGYYADEAAAKEGREELEAEVEAELSGAGDIESTTVEVEDDVVIVEVQIDDFD